MSRREFSKKIKRAAFARANGRCESCGADLRGKPVHYDHDIADDLGGEPILENCRLTCIPCHAEKTAGHDMPLIAKGRRIRERNMGIKRTSRPLAGTRASGLRKRMNGNVERWPP
jgi:5-methylcytosine-specific restriction endonuclease McrA